MLYKFEIRKSTLSFIHLTTIDYIDISFNWINLNKIESYQKNISRKT